ncbi:MAG: permease [Alphaproteobacteria bacterium]|nr:permease [Alphaproteobacteria bacterium]
MRLFWRDWVYLLTAGRANRLTVLIIALGIFIGLMHVLAVAIIAPLAAAGIAVDKATLVIVTGGLFLATTTMISQAMDSVTRAFYSRGDLDLILSSPVPPNRIFAVRMVAIALTTTVLSVVIAGPFINALAIFAGARWLAAYGAIIALGAASTGFALVLTIGLFRSIGPKLTRTISQIISALIGAAFVIGVQVAAILSIGNYSRFSMLSSEPVMAMAPDITSAMWWPARAAMGDIAAFFVLALICLSVLGLVIIASAEKFGDHVITASGIAFGAAKRQSRHRRFAPLTPRRALRRKEWMTLRRDPWLISESLMQILYLVPPALLLWLTYAEHVGSLLIIVPVMVMSAGQLAGGLTWLAVSGEDAPQLVGSAPVSPGAIIAAKIEAVLAAIALVFAPLLAGLALASPWLAAVAALGIAVAALSSAMIQIWFRAQAKRSRFRSRQTSSRLATLAEAFSSIFWAGTAALAAAGTWLAVGAALIALITLASAKAMSPSAQPDS